MVPLEVCDREALQITNLCGHLRDPANRACRPSTQWDSKEGLWEALKTELGICCEKLFPVGGIFNLLPSARHCLHCRAGLYPQEAGWGRPFCSRFWGPQPDLPRGTEGWLGQEALTFDTVVGAVCCCPSWAALSATYVPPTKSPKQGKHKDAHSWHYSWSPLMFPPPYRQSLREHWETGKTSLIPQGGSLAQTQALWDHASLS
jgi:hypothetical protein